MKLMHILEDASVYIWFKIVKLNASLHGDFGVGRFSNADLEIDINMLPFSPLSLFPCRIAQLTIRHKIFCVTQ